MSLEVTGLRALAHPIRLRILSLLTGTELSAAEIARELDISHANASYHLRQLAAAGEVVVAGEERIRGGVAKRYRHPWDAAPRRSADADVGDRAVFVHALATELERRFRVRVPGRAHLTDAELWVSQQVWDEVFGLVEQASTLLHAQALRPRADGALHVNMTAALFAMGEGQA
jgi:DNA-binding transcriptional ArsR family regulator